MASNSGYSSASRAQVLSFQLPFQRSNDLLPRFSSFYLLGSDRVENTLFPPLPQERVYRAAAQKCVWYNRPFHDRRIATAIHATVCNKKRDTQLEESPYTQRTATARTRKFRWCREYIRADRKIFSVSSDIGMQTSLTEVATLHHDQTRAWIPDRTPWPYFFIIGGVGLSP
jgi:hypothetical protein